MSVRAQKYAQMRHAESNLLTKYSVSSWFDQVVDTHSLGIIHPLNIPITLVIFLSEMDGIHSNLVINA